MHGSRGGMGGLDTYYLFNHPHPPLWNFFGSAHVINSIRIIYQSKYSLIISYQLTSAKNYLNCNHSTLNDFYPLHFDLILTYWPFCPPPLAPVGWLLYLSCSPSTTRTHLPFQTISTKYSLIISLWIKMNINLTSFIRYRYVINKFI